MLEFLCANLAAAIVIHVGHRPGLEEFHDREIRLVRQSESGPAMALDRPYPPLRRFLRRLMRPGTQAGITTPIPRPVWNSLTR